VLDRFALVLVEERDGVDQGEVFFVVAAGSGSSAGEGEMPREGVGNFERLDEALRVLKEVLNVLSFLGGEDSFDGAGLPLQLVDSLGLLFRFIDGEDEAAVHELFVDVD
jgi:hypothetical protein